MEEIKYFAEERKSKILQIIDEENTVSVNDLCTRFNVSPGTIRNDLNSLQQRGLILRTHGGAMKLTKDQVSTEPFPAEKREIMLSQKQAIAQKAAEFVNDGDTLAITTSTTTMELAKILSGKRRLTIVLNDINMAAWLEKNTNHNLFILGGIIRKNFHYVSFNCDNLPRINIDKIFFSCNGFDSIHGATIPDFNLASNVRCLLKRSRESYLLCDSSKIGRVAFSQIATLDELTSVIIDNGIKQSDLDSFDEEARTKLHIV